MTTTQTLAPGAVDIDLLAAAVASSRDLQIVHGPSKVDLVPHWATALLVVAAAGSEKWPEVTVYDNGLVVWWPGHGELREVTVPDTDEAMDLLSEVLVGGED